MRYLIIFLICTTCLKASNRACTDGSMPDKIVDILQQQKYKHANWGILLKDLNSKKIVLEQNSNQLFIPGSTTKIFTVAALLKTYGADYRFKTPLYATGPIQNSTLKGDLILVGQGDLVFGGRQTLGTDDVAFTKLDHIYANDLPQVMLTPQDPLTALKQLAKNVKDQGITCIEGDVLIDDRLFETIQLRGIVVSPLMINENLFDVIIRPTEEGSPASISWRPMVEGYPFVNKCQTVAAGGPLQIEIHADGTVEGTIPLDQEEAIRIVPIKNPKEFARAALIQALKEQGIAIQEQNSQLPDSYAQMKPIAVWTSPPLYNYAKLILKVSHNVGADLVPLLLATGIGEKTFDKGMLQLGKFVTDEVKVSPDAFVFIDGAGGDSNRLTPQAEIQLLQYVKNWPKEQFQRFYNALPILGVDGSLEDFGKKTAAVGKVRAKTGTGISFNLALGQFFLTSETLAGYIEGRDGHLYAFMISVNNATMPKIEDIFPIFEDQAQMSAEFYNITN